jgi:hypothetical protein
MSSQILLQSEFETFEALSLKKLIKNKRDKHIIIYV